MDIFINKFIQLFLIYCFLILFFSNFVNCGHFDSITDQWVENDAEIVEDESVSGYGGQDNDQIFEDEIEEVGTSEIKELSLEERMKEMMNWKIEKKSDDDPQTEKEIEEEKNWQVKFLENAYKDYYPLAGKSEKAKEINEQKKYTKLENALKKVKKFNRKMLLLLTNLKRLQYIQKQLQIYEHDKANKYNDKPIKDLRANFNLLKEGNFETYLIVVNICKNITKLFENNKNELKKYDQFCNYQKHGVNCIFKRFDIVYTEEDEKDEQEVINFIENFIKEEIKKVKRNKKDLKKNNRGRIIVKTKINNNKKNNNCCYL